MWQLFQKCILKVIAARIEQLSLRLKIIFTVTANILCILLILHIFFQGDYASIDAMQKKAASDKDPDQMLYAEGVQSLNQWNLIMLK